MERADRAEEPGSVLLDRSAQRTLDVIEQIDAVGSLNAASLQVIREVARLEALVLVTEKAGATQFVAAVPRDHVQPDAAAGHVGRGAAGGVDHFLAHRAVEVVLHRPVAVKAVHHQPVHLDHRLRRAHAVRGHVGLLHRTRAAHVGDVQRDAGDQLPHPLNRAPRRNRVERLPVQNLGLRGALHVHDRRRSADRHRLFERADLQLGVHGHGEVGWQLQTFALDTGEPGEREGQGVHARTQVNQAVPAVFVGRSDAGFFDQHGARGLDRDAREHGSGRVFYDARERTLRPGDCRHEAQTGQCQQYCFRCVGFRHSAPPSLCVVRARSKMPAEIKPRVGLHEMKEEGRCH